MALEHRTNGPVRHELPSNLLHDMRTPLNQIIGFSELLSEQAQDAGYVALLPDLMKVCNAGQNLLSLINGNFHSGISAPLAQDLVHHIPLVESLRKEPAEEVPFGTVSGYVLVVDDDEGNRDVLSQRLEGQGYAVDTAENGDRALEMLRDDNFDLVLLDLLMAGTDGFEVLKQIKGDDRLKHIPVIMISALDEMDSIARCIEMGAEDYLPKPFNPTLLKARISATLEKKRARDSEKNLFHKLEENYKRLEDLERAREDLTQMIVHDLRTPLTSVITGMHTLEVVGDLNDDQRSTMRIAISGGDALLGMINDLLDVERAESEGMQLLYAEVSVSALIASAIEQVASLVADQSLKLAQEVSPDLPLLSADESKLRRTLVNLLGNAIKFTPQGGVVTIGAKMSLSGSSIEFFVRDTGEGIPAEALEHIFDKFGQVATRKGGRLMGSGLGLTFCKAAVEAHDGHISIQSTPGHESVFTFDIPLKRAAQESAVA